MGTYNKDQILQMYNTRMNSVLTRIDRRRQEEDEAAYDEYLKNQDKMAMASAALSTLDVVGKAADRKLARLLEQTYPVAGEHGDLKKFEPKPPRSFEEWVKSPGETFKRLTPSGQIQETEAYTKWKTDKALKEGVAAE